MNDEQTGKEMLEKYEKLTEEEQLNFWSGLLLLLALEKKHQRGGQLMTNLRRKFTKWYFRKGYTFGYDFNGIETVGGDDIFPAMPTSMPKAVWKCPWYVRPLLFLFSPSVYQSEWGNEYIVKGFMEGLAKGLETNDKL